MQPFISGPTLKNIFKLCSMIGHNKLIKITPVKFLKKTFGPVKQFQPDCGPKLCILIYQYLLWEFFSMIEHTKQRQVKWDFSKKCSLGPNGQFGPNFWPQIYASSYLILFCNNFFKKVHFKNLKKSNQIVIKLQPFNALCPLKGHTY